MSRASQIKRLGALLLLALCFLRPVASAEAPDQEPAQRADARLEGVLARLEEKMSVMRTLRTRFIQEKHLAVLDQPLVLTGAILMQKPTLFAWHVEEPLRYSMVIQGDVVRQWDEDSDQVQKVSLSKNPAVKMAIRQMRDWFSGAYRSMLGEYEVMVLDEDPVSLRFTPRQDSLTQAMLESVTVIFEADERYIEQIRIVEAGGDSTLLTFVDTLLNGPIDPSAWKLEHRVR